jgi:hypothetical protein
VTVAELIAALRAADPTGMLPVCVGNEDIYFVDALPAYYDGSLQQLVHDEAKRGKAWSVIGAKIIRSGRKVNLRALSIRDVLIDMPDLPIEGGDPAQIARWREEAREDVSSTKEQPIDADIAAMCGIPYRCRRCDKYTSSVMVCWGCQMAYPLYPYFVHWFVPTGAFYDTLSTELRAMLHRRDTPRSVARQ